MAELRLDAVSTEQTDAVLPFVNGILEEMNCPPEIQTEIDMAVEELFVNIASYAYPPGTGPAVIRIEAEGDPPAAVITLIDSGVPFNPLAKPDPDLSLSLDERPIGGLGIYMAKNSMDACSYTYENGRNILTLKKNLYFPAS